MSDYKVYGDTLSGNCLKVKWTLDLLGEPYEWIETDILKSQTRTPSFLALNAAGQVPVLVTRKGRALAQSNAILLYLVEKHGGGLLPKNEFDRAKVYEWLFWEQYSHEPFIAVRRFLLTYLKKPESELDPRLKERGLAALARMEAALGETRWIAGERFTLADVALFAYTRVAPEGGFDLAAFPAVSDWVRRTTKRLEIEAA